MNTTQEHWETVYRSRGPREVSWHQEDPARSLALIEASASDRHVPIVDVGGGASHLADRLVGAGFTDITVLDVSATALDYARQRLGPSADDVTWIVADITEHDFDRAFAIWHDRAVFHFLTAPTDRDLYLTALQRATGVGSHVIVAAFSLDGPDVCSGLPVQRYSEGSLIQTLGPAYRPVGFQSEAHTTPAGVTQHFIYGRFERV